VASARVDGTRPRGGLRVTLAAIAGRQRHRPSRSTPSADPGDVHWNALRGDGTGVFTRFAWALPGDGPGAWVETTSAPCRAGIHACRLADLPYWAGRALYGIELAGDVIEHTTKIVAARGRLLRRIDAYDDAFRATYPRHCADRAHENGVERGKRSSSPPSPRTGPARVVAARIAEEAGGVEAYHAERPRQTDWPAARIGLV
jgi:hypothetical protein